MSESILNGTLLPLLLFLIWGGFFYFKAIHAFTLSRISSIFGWE
jgi:hypothetical protein